MRQLITTLLSVPPADRRDAIDYLVDQGAMLPTTAALVSRELEAAPICEATQQLHSESDEIGRNGT